MNLRSVIVGAALAALAGCQSADLSVVQASEPLIQDAVHNGGRPGFYFLPPLVEPTALPPVFDGSLSLFGRLDGPDATAVLTFPLVVDLKMHLYQGTLDTAGRGLLANTVYRLRVFAGALELGFIDIRILARGQSGLNGDTYDLVNGKKVKVKVYVTK